MSKIPYKSSNGKDTWMIDSISLTCTCPDYRYRKAKVKGYCKHLSDFIEKLNGEDLNYLEIIQKDNDALSFVEKYGEEILDRLKAAGEIYEERGKLYVLS